MAATSYFDYQAESVHRHWVGTMGKCKCYDEQDFSASGTYDPNYPPKDEKPSQFEINKLFLLNRRNEEIKRAWKKDQYAKVKCQFR